MYWVPVIQGEKINLAKFNFVERGGRGGQPVKDVVFLWLEQFSFVNIQTLHTEYSHTDYVNPLFYAGLLTGARGTA
jgi:hypothetical protein